MSLNLGSIEIGHRGRFRAVVHTGHEYDADGNIIKYGDVLRETPFGRNKIVNGGFDYWLTGSISGGGSYHIMICGPSNTAPVETDTVMGDAFGYAAGFVSSVQTASNSTPAAGQLFCTIQHRRTFLPGSLGSTAVNISKAAIIASTVSTPTQAQIRSMPLLCAGLLVDGSGNPTSISVGPAEYLDLIWEHTEYLPNDATGTFTLTVDGVDTTVGYTVRCMNLFEHSDSRYGYWGSLATTSTSVSPQFVSRNAINIGSYNPTVLGYSATGLSAPNTNPTPPGTIVNLAPQSVRASTYIAGSKQRSFSATWPLARGNATPNCNVLKLVFNDNGAFQIIFDPPIAKTAARQLDLSFTLSMANMP